jgi:hypothetical protein
MVTKTSTKKVKPPKEVINVGPCSDDQALVFQRSKEVDFMLIGRICLAV